MIICYWVDRFMVYEGDLVEGQSIFYPNPKYNEDYVAVQTNPSECVWIVPGTYKD